MSDAWVGVIGGLAGVLLGGAMTFVGQRSEARRQESVRAAYDARDDQLRWYESRRALYAEWLAVANRAVEAIAMMGIARLGLDVTTRFDDDPEADLAQANRELVIVHASLDLVASNDVRQMCEKFSGRVVAARYGSDEENIATSTDYDEVAKGVVSAFMAVREGMRADIGMPPLERA